MYVLHIHTTYPVLVPIIVVNSINLNLISRLNNSFSEYCAEYAVSNCQYDSFFLPICY